MKARWLCSFVLLAATALSTACGDGPTASEAAARVPNGHPSVGLASRFRSVDEFADEARRRDLALVCGQGGLAPRWALCMVRADGVVAVVGFGGTAGIDVRLTGMSHDGILVPLEPTVVYGVLEPSGKVHLLIESRGREIGELEGEL